MTEDQAFIFAVAAILLLFVRGSPRYDVVALFGLLAVTLAGLVAADQAFAGFGHPAVITVGAVLVISKALQNSGVVDLAGRFLVRAAGRRRVASPDGAG